MPFSPAFQYDFVQQDAFQLAFTRLNLYTQATPSLWLGTGNSPGESTAVSGYFELREDYGFELDEDRSRELRVGGGQFEELRQDLNDELREDGSHELREPFA